MSTYRVHVVGHYVILESHQKYGNHVNAHSKECAQKANEEDQGPAVEGALVKHTPEDALHPLLAGSLRTHIVAHRVFLVLHALGHLKILALFKSRLPFLEGAVSFGLFPA